MQRLARVVFSIRLYSYYVTVLVLVFCRLNICFTSHILYRFN